MSRRLSPPVDAHGPHNDTETEVPDRFGHPPRPAPNNPSESTGCSRRPAPILWLVFSSRAFSCQRIQPLANPKTGGETEERKNGRMEEWKSGRVGLGTPLACTCLAPHTLGHVVGGGRYFARGGARLRRAAFVH